MRELIYIGFCSGAEGLITVPSNIVIYTCPHQFRPPRVTTYTSVANTDDIYIGVFQYSVQVITFCDHF